MRTKSILFICILLGANFVQLACTKSPVVEPAIPKAKAAAGATVLVTEAEISALRLNKDRYAALIKGVTAKLDYQPTPVTDFSPDAHYNADGVNTNGNNAKQLAADALMAYRSGFCYLVTGDARFAATTQRILDGWAGTLTKVSTDQGKADISFNLPYMIIAASWVRDANKWSSDPFSTFLRKTILPVSQISKSNNHGLWGGLMNASAAVFLGDTKMLNATRERWEVLMQEEVSADGSMPAEMERSATSNWRGGPDKGIRGMAYTHYALMPASLTAKIFADQGQPVWQSSGGKLLQSAYDRAAAWTLHPETFPYYASNNGQLQGVRDAAYFVLLLPHFPNQDAAAVVAQGNLGLNGFLIVELFGKP